MSKSSRKLWESTHTLSYDLMKLHTWEVAKFQYQFICTSTLSSPKLAPDTVLPSDLQQSRRPPSSWGRLGWSRAGVGLLCHTAQTCRGQCRWMGGVSDAIAAVSSLDYSDCIFAFVNPAMFRTPVANGVCEFWNDTEIKGKKDHVRSNVQAAAATFSNLDWKTKR